MAKSQDEVKSINKMNNAEAKQIIKARKKELEQKGSMKEQDFTHVKQNLKMQANQLLSEHYKKKG